MSYLALFGFGVAVTLLVGASISLLVWGAILDGRYEEQEAEARAASRSGADVALPAIDPVRGEP